MNLTPQGAKRSINKYNNNSLTSAWGIAGMADFHYMSYSQHFLQVPGHGSYARACIGSNSPYGILCPSLACSTISTLDHVAGRGRQGNSVGQAPFGAWSHGRWSPGTGRRRPKRWPRRRGLAGTPHEATADSINEGLHIYIYMYKYLCVHVYIYIYVYIFVYRDQDAYICGYVDV